MLHYSGVTYAVAFGYRPLQLDLWVPAAEEAQALVVWVHGGGWMFDDPRYLPETLRPNRALHGEALADASPITQHRHRRPDVRRLPGRGVDGP